MSCFMYTILHYLDGSKKSCPFLFSNVLNMMTRIACSRCTFALLPATVYVLTLLSFCSLSSSHSSTISMSFLHSKLYSKVAFHWYGKRRLSAEPLACTTLHVLNYCAPSYIIIIIEPSFDCVETRVRLEKTVFIVGLAFVDSYVSFFQYTLLSCTLI